MTAESATFESTNARYSASLDSALTQFRTLLSTVNSRSWKPLPSTGGSSTSSSSSPFADPSSRNSKGKGRELVNGIGSVDLPHVQVHKRAVKGQADVVRAVAELPASVNAAGESNVDLESFKAVLQTSEVRGAWDKLIEKAHSIEMLDPQTRITKTDYRLGWPASPRDTITISKTFSDETTLIDISTSLPRTPDEPAFLRPAPPFVRSHVHLLAWCVQALPASSPTDGTVSSSSTTASAAGKIRITIFWQWTLKGAVFTTHHSQLASLLAHFVDFVRERGSQIPLVHSYGRGIELSSCTFEPSQELHTIEYAVVVESNDDDVSSGSEVAYDELMRRKERKRLERAIELSLAAKEGWDVRVTTKIVGGLGGSEADWTSTAGLSNGGRGESGRIALRLTHAALANPNHLVRVSVLTQRLAGGKILKINGENVQIHAIESRDPSSSARRLVEVDDAASIVTTSTSALDSNVAVGSPGQNASGFSDSSRSAGRSASPALPASPSPVADEISSLLRRNYIYFTSLLQEPEAKWRNVSDNRGVTVTQLNSIDPTLTIYRAEATFVGVGVWDVFSTICTPHARMQWDKTLEDATLLEDVNELSELWHIKTKPSWPVVARDSVTLRTAYKSPSSVHIFSFSTDDDILFPSIPTVRPPTIRTQTDLYGWAIEALSPTTTQITLLDQSDPKGWSNKSWTPTQMINAVAGVGDFSIKFGGPPVVTRLLGAKATVSKYDWEAGVLRAEYMKASVAPQALTLPGDDFEASSVAVASSSAGAPTVSGLADCAVQLIECEIRCDCITWSSSIDILIDPPPLKVSCLLRHRLSSGGGLWVTIEHEPSAIDNEEGRVMVTVRKGAGGREKGSVTVNGAKARVDVELLPEDEVKLLTKKKRVKASPIPLDQYSTHGPRSWQRSPSASGRNSPLPPTDENMSTSVDTMASKSSLPSTSSPLAQPPAASIAAIAPPSTVETAAPASEPSKAPVQPPGQALEALAWLQTFHAEQGPELTDPAPGWAIVSERAGGTTVRKKLLPRISETLSIYRGDRIIQGMTADEIANIVSNVGCRKAWDDRIDTAMTLASFGLGCTSSVLTIKPNFPWKGRVFYVSTVNASVKVPSASSTSSTSTVLFCASSSYSTDPAFDPAKVNPSSLLEGKVLLEGWILETLDPYASSLLAIPSTRCTYVTCVDHAGSMPLALNSMLNANLAKMMGNVESLGKAKGPLPRLLTPASCLQVEGPLSDDGDQECVWKLSGSAAFERTMVLSAVHSVEDGSTQVLLKIGGTGLKSMMGASGSDKDGFSVAPGSILKGELPRSASLIFAGAASAPSLHRAASNSDLARKSSRTSLRAVPSPASTTTATTTRSKSPDKAVVNSAVPASAAIPDPSSMDFLVAELIVDLKQFPHGYAIATTTSLISAMTPSTSDSNSEPPPTLSIDSLRSLAPQALQNDSIPLRCTAHDAPLPSILSASLESWKRHNHLVRVLVPTSAITHPIQDPLRDQGNGKSLKEELKKPEWFKRLAEKGALVEIRIVPLPSEGEKVETTKAAEASKLIPPRSSTSAKVTFNGERISVATQKESKSVLARLEDDDAPLRARSISRVPRRKAKSSTAAESDSAIPTTAATTPSILPEDFRRPLAVAVRLLAPPKEEAPNRGDDLDYPDPKSPEAVTPMSEDGGLRSPLLGGSKRGSISLIGRRDTVSSDNIKDSHASAGSGTPLLGGILGAYPLSRFLDGTSMTASLPSMTTGGGGDTLTTSGQRGATGTYSLSFVLVVAIISFLLGSLLRSLLTPADYILYANTPSPDATGGAAAGGAELRALMNAFTDRRWREARRLLELRALPGFARWDLIVALCKRD